MAVVLRLARLGSKRRPFYRIVAADSRYPRDGRFIETVGIYHPINPEEKQVVLKDDRVNHWLSKGAKPTDTVNSIIKKHIKKSDAPKQTEGAAE